MTKANFKIRRQEHEDAVALHEAYPQMRFGDKAWINPKELRFVAI